MEPFVQEFEFEKDGESLRLTSIVVDEVDFREAVGFLRASGALSDQPPEWDQIGFLPLTPRTPTTEPIFQRYSVRTPYLAMLIRGRGPELAERVLGI